MRAAWLVTSEKEGAGRLVQEVQTHFSSYVRGGVQQTGLPARLGHTPPGFTGLVALETPEKRADARKVVTREGTISGVLEGKCTSAF